MTAGSVDGNTLWSHHDVWGLVLIVILNYFVLFFVLIFSLSDDFFFLRFGVRCVS